MNTHGYPSLFRTRFRPAPFDGQHVHPMPLAGTVQPSQGPYTVEHARIDAGRLMLSVRDALGQVHHIVLQPGTVNSIVEQVMQTQEA